MFRLTYQWKHLPSNKSGRRYSVFYSFDDAINTLRRWSGGDWEYKIVSLGRCRDYKETELYPHVIDIE